MTGSCRVRGLGRTLTPLATNLPLSLTGRRKFRHAYFSRNKEVVDEVRKLKIAPPFHLNQLCFYE